MPTESHAARLIRREIGKVEAVIAFKEQEAKQLYEEDELS